MKRKRICGACGLVKPNSEFYSNIQTKRKSTCKACTKQRRLEHKIEKFNAYGGCKCVCCEETLLEFLTLDHIGNSKKEFEMTMCRGLRTDGFPHKDKLRVLCMNCNWSIGVHGYCPHHRLKTVIK